jgi:putative transposase
MTRTRYQFLPGDSHPYFITATTVNWLPLFSNQDIVAILLDSLAFLITQQRLDLYAYVIMENHIHMIASAETIAKEISNFKSFTPEKVSIITKDNKIWQFSSS